MHRSMIFLALVAMLIGPIDGHLQVACVVTLNSSTAFPDQKDIEKVFGSESLKSIKERKIGRFFNNAEEATNFCTSVKIKFSGAISSDVISKPTWLSNKTARTSSRNIFGDILGTLSSAAKEFNGICVWGFNCGGKCAPYEKYGSRRYKDDLDKACLIHDICLCKARSASARRRCDERLKISAWQVWNEEDDCAPWNFACANSDVAAAARDVYNAMALFGSGECINCSCKMHRCR